MPRLLWLCEYATLNGGERSLLATVPSVQQAGFEVTALVPQAGPFCEELASSGVRIVPFAFVDAAGSRWSQAELRERLARSLQNERPDLLVANSVSMSRLAGPVAAALEVSSLGHLRDIVGLSRQAVSDINQHCRLLAVSRATRAAHLAQGIAAEITQVQYNGVDLDRFCPRPRTGRLARELGIPESAPLMGTVGQLVLRKGQDVLVQAIMRLRDRLPQAHFVIIGERYSGKLEAREFEEELRSSLVMGNCADRVHFLGYRDDMPRLLPELTLLVHPARQEPLGRVLLEAAAAGLPIVATDMGGTSEIFPSNTAAATLIPPNDPAALADAIVELTTDEERRQALGASARRRAATFDIRQRAAETAAHYLEVLRQGRGGGQFESRREIC